MATTPTTRRRRGCSSLLFLVALSFAVLGSASIPQPNFHLEQQEQCLALLSRTFSNEEAASIVKQKETCRRLAELFSSSAASPTMEEHEEEQQLPPQEPAPHLRSSFFRFLSSSFQLPSHNYATTGDYATFKDPDDVLNLCVALACVLCAAMAAGLTIGLMSLDPLSLEIRERVGTAEECRQASVVLPLIQRHHYLLVTLLLYNSAANETLPLFLDRLVPSYVAVIISVTMVLIFGEILPSALFSGPNQLKIAARMAPFVWFLMLILSPISYPLAWCLDRFFGRHNPRKRYNREELSALIEIHQEVKRRNISIVASSTNQSTSHPPIHSSSATTARAGLLSVSNPGTKGDELSLLGRPPHVHPHKAGGEGGKGGGEGGGGSAGADAMLSQDEVDIVVGVLKIASKTVADCMVPMDKVFCLSTHDELDEPMLSMIMASGYSRIPVYEGTDPSSIRGFLLVKRLIVLDPTSHRRVGSLSLRQPLVVSPLCPLIDLLNSFQEGRSHLALVSAEPHTALDCITQKRPLTGGAAPLGIITLEDVIEEILQEEILDEHDRTREEMERRRQRGTKQILSASLLRKGEENNNHEDTPSSSSSTTTTIQQQVVVDLAVNSMRTDATTMIVEEASSSTSTSPEKRVGVVANLPPLVHPSVALPTQASTSPHHRFRHFVTADPKMVRRQGSGEGGGQQQQQHQRAVSADAAGGGGGGRGGGEWRRGLSDPPVMEQQQQQACKAIPEEGLGTGEGQGGGGLKEPLLPAGQREY